MVEDGKYMALKCFNCNKGIMYGHKVSHAKNRTRRIFKPNLHYARIVAGEGMKRVRLCVKCLRMLKKEAREKLSKAQGSVSSVAVRKIYP